MTNQSMDNTTDVMTTTTELIRLELLKLRRERDEAQHKAEELYTAIEKALATAARRWCEWGERAETVEEILDNALTALPWDKSQ